MRSRLHLSLCWLVAMWGLPSDSVAEEVRRWPSELIAGRFEIHSDFQLGDESTLVAELNGVCSDMAKLLQFTPAEAPIHIVLFETPSEYRRYMNAYFPALPQRRAIFIQDRGPGMLFAHWHAKVATDLRHEVSHALLNTQHQALPLWLDEGLAEYFEADAANRFRRNDYLHQVAGRCQRGYVPRLSELEQFTELEHFQDAQYRDSWSWVHFVLHRRSSTRDLLARYIQQTRAGERQLSFSRQLQQLVPDLENEYVAHFRQLASGD
ncbi:MAG: DUF1570 domain-containing protein [Planctomycetales bacterium]|nr:DUF1570 domain-containing protein [Planctomycetales bacterium]